MQVQLALKEWRIDTDSKTKLSKVVGKYATLAGDKEVGLQAFNEYSGKEIAFSSETMAAILAVEAVIKTELEKLFS